MAENSDQKTLYIIDGHAQIFRAYHAISSLSSPVTKEPTNATFGFVGMLLKLWREQRPDYVVMALDVSGEKETFRSELYPDYKANREAPPEDLHPQVQRIVEICRVMGIPVLGTAGFEADDVIATLCEEFADREDLRLRLVSRDKDLQQLLGERVEMFDIHKDETIDLARLKEKTGITPEQVVDMLALMGDTVDNIPGLPGVGPKTAAKWIDKYGSIEGLYDNLDAVTPKQREKLDGDEVRERLKRNRELVELRRDVPVEFELDDAKVRPLPVDRLRTIFKQLGFGRHLADLEELGGESAPGESAPGEAAQADAGPAAVSDDVADGLFAHFDEMPAAPTAAASGGGDYAAVTSAEAVAELVNDIREAVDGGAGPSGDTETTSSDAMQAELCGVSLAWKTGHGVYVPVLAPDGEEQLDAAAVLDALRPLLEAPDVPKVGQNLKYDLNVLRRAGVELRGIAFDTMVASYVLDATRNSHKLDNLALAHLQYEMVPLTDLIGTGKDQITFNRVPLDRAAPYAAEDADIVLRLRQMFQPQLKAMGLTDLLEQLEMPLVEVLAELEYNGICIDPDELDRQAEAMEQRVVELRRRIVETAGVDFSPDSPRQLAEVLFGELGCKVIRRGKTGPSTDSEVLQRVADEQNQPGADVARLVLEYRELTKLVGTYLSRLKDYIHPETGRIHASFNQTGTATGRLSSNEPNLQNIPIRTDLGRQIRKAFVAPEDHVLLAADYSQIELRLLAHLSGDEGLIDAFQADEDIHTAVAAEVFGVAPDEVTGEQRGSAKMVNFGIVYGITPWGLARRLGPGVAPPGEDPVDYAKRIIDNYKRRYPKIDAFLDRCVEQARTRGYVETICKRRRLIPEINSQRGNVMQLGRRMAINTAVQGSAADLIKTAMVQLHRRIRAEDRPMKMLLQIHDELVVETPQSQADEEAAVLVETMTGAMDLSVPLKVELARGRNWYDAK